MKKNNWMIRLAAAVLALCLVLPLVMAAAEGEYLARGSEGEAVVRLQARLRELGYLTEEAQEGVLDEATENALIRFQQQNDLLASGILDRFTEAVLYSDEAERAYVRTDYVEEAMGGLWNLIPMATGLPARGYAKAPATEVYEEEAYFMPSMGAWDDSFNTNEYRYYTENGFITAARTPLSTFAADIDTASYAQVRSAILKGREVAAGSVRPEEMINYFRYSYPEPRNGEPFGVGMELKACPWNPEHLLLQVGLQAQKISAQDRPGQNLVFLIDVSGSMDSDEKLPLVKRAFLLLLEELNPEDTISIVTYASWEEVVLEGVPAREKTRIMEAINSLEPWGATNGSAGLRMAYDVAQKHWIEGGTNRILLATDGDLNLGETDEASIARLITDKRRTGVTISVLGFGYGNYKDNKMETIADLGNGNYHYVDSILEARRALVEESGATFNVVAKDVKLQLDFNPAYVKAYRLIGYEDRLLTAEQFEDDTVDGGEIGSGHRVTVLYEIVPETGDGTAESGSRYTVSVPVNSAEWLTLNVRCKQPEGTESTLYTYPLVPQDVQGEWSDNMRFAAAVAEVAMLLRGSEHSGSATYASALELLRGCGDAMGDVYKEEFVYLTGLLARSAD